MLQNNPYLVTFFEGIEIYSVWYSLRLAPVFYYNALGFLNDDLTQNISVRKNKVRLD